MLVPKSQPLIEAGDVIVFTAEPVKAGVASEQEQRRLYLAIETELSNLAQDEGFELITRAEIRSRFARELQQSDLVSEEYRLKLGDWRQANAAVNVELLELGTKEGKLEESKTYTGKQVFSRTDSGRCQLVLRVTDFETITERTKVVGPFELPFEFEQTGKPPKAFSRPAILDELVDELVVRVRKVLSAYELKKVRIYTSYPAFIVAGASIDSPSLISSTRDNLAHGLEAFEKRSWKRALESFEAEWKLVEEGDYSDEARARVKWDIGITLEYMKQYAEALVAIRDCVRLSTSAERRLKRIDLKDRVEALGLAQVEPEESGE